MEMSPDDRSSMATTRQAFDLSDPVHLRAEMARAGIAPMHNRPYDDPERGWVDPLDDDETRTIVRRFLAALWRACERAEAEGGNAGSEDLLRRCVDAFLNASPMVFDGKGVPGYVSVHVTEEFRDEVIAARLAAAET